MNDNVIYGVFAGSARQSALRDRQIARLRQIEGAVGRAGFGKKGYVLGLSDRIVAARATGTLVADARKAGISVTQVRQVLESKGTSRIDRYMLPPSVDEATARARAEKLQAKVSGYLAVAEAIATLTDADPDTLKLNVLVGTSLWSKPVASITDEDPRAGHLALELIEMGKAVVRKRKMQDLFALARRVPGQWDVASSSLEKSDGPSLAADSYLEWFEHWTEAPPLPSVPLVRSLQALFPLPNMRLENNGRANPAALQQLTKDFEGETVSGWLELWRETRLAIGPTTAACEIGLMFETRAYVRVAIEGQAQTPIEVVPSCTLKPQDDPTSRVPAAVFQAHLEGCWRRIDTVDRLDEVTAQVYDGADLFYWSANPLDPKSPADEHWYISWAPVNSSTVAHWLDRPTSLNTNVVVPHDGLRPSKPTWYVKGSLAHVVERDLASGGLERALGQAVEVLSRELSAREQQWRADAQSAHEQRMAFWATSNQEQDRE